MSARNLFNMVSNISRIINELEAVGIRVEIGDDFSHYRLIRTAQADRSPMYPMFDVSCSYVDGSNGFWICGYDQQDELVHTQAVRSFDLSGVSLRQHIDLHRHKYITPDTTPDPDQTFYSGARALASITGKVCYHGDFWIRAFGLGGPRSRGLTPHLSRILFELALRTWEPDYVFALVPKQLAEKGAHLRYGYTHCEPGVWTGPDKQVTDEDWLLWMSRHDIVNFLDAQPQSLRAQEQISRIGSALKSVDSMA